MHAQQEDSDFWISPNTHIFVWLNECESTVWSKLSREDFNVLIWVLSMYLILESVHLSICTRAGWKVVRLKNSYDDIISTVDDFLDQWDPSIAAPIEEVCGAQGRLCWKINLIWSHSMRVSWSVYELFGQHSYKWSFTLTQLYICFILSKLKHQL